MTPIDALGQALVIGNKYGYSSSAGSWITVVVGTLTKINDKKVTLEVLSRNDFLYGEPHQRDWVGTAPKVHIHPCHLFSVTSS